MDVVFTQALSRSVADYHAEQDTSPRRAGEALVALVTGVRTMLQLRAAEQRGLVGFAVGLALAILASAVLLAVWTVRSITQPLAHAVSVADRIAAGRLDHRIDLRNARNAEAARLLDAFTSMQGALSSIAREIQASADEIRHASVQVADGNADLSARTENQASSLEETAATMEELTATVKRNGRERGARHPGRDRRPIRHARLRAVSEVVRP